MPGEKQRRVWSLLVASVVISLATTGLAQIPGLPGMPSAEDTSGGGASTASDRGSESASAGAATATATDTATGGASKDDADGALPSETGAPSVAPEEAIRSNAKLQKRMDDARDELLRLHAGIDLGPDVERLEEEVPRARASLREVVASARDAVVEAKRAHQVRDVVFRLRQENREHERWKQLVQARAKRVASAHGRIDKQLEYWKRVLELAKASRRGPDVVSGIESVVRAAQLEALEATRRGAEMEALEAQIDELIEMTTSAVAHALAEGPNLLEDWQQTDFPIWVAIVAAFHLDGLRARVAGAVVPMVDSGIRFLESQKHLVLAQIAVLLVALVVLLALRSEANKLSGEHTTAQRCLSHPVMGAVMLASSAGWVIYRDVPSAVGLLSFVGVLVPSLVIFPPILTPQLRRAFYVASMFVTLDLVRIALVEMVYLERVLLTVEAAVVTFLVAYALRTKLHHDLDMALRWRRVATFIGQLWVFLLAVSFVAAVFGYGHIASILGDGTLSSIYRAIVFGTTYVALSSILSVLFQSPWTSALHSLRRHSELVFDRAILVLRWVLFLGWIKMSVASFTLSGVVWKGLVALLGVSLNLGTLNVSVGTFVTLGGGVLLASWAARFVRFVLSEDVLPRMGIALPTQSALSSTVFYTVLIVGLFATLAASGIELGKLTVLVGALGVGIGFGLQNVIQNFVAGLILLFSRPIKAGDVIQVGDLVGTTQSIGFRASVVRTFEGAEVIVPNANLISDQVINWTLSDQRRRVEVDIGVDYGTDPERVIQILERVAAEHAEVAKEPAPVALFLAHGASSLDFQLRVWALQDDWVRVHSEITTRINRAITEAGIGIPFPQRDLHLRSVDTAAIEAIERATKR